MNILWNYPVSLAFGLALLTSLANAADNPKSVALFNGRDLAGWKTVGGKGEVQWKVGRAVLDATSPTKMKSEQPGDELVSPISGVNLATEESFGDCRLELEFMVAAHSNSGVKMMNIYEIQIFDSFGKEKPNATDCGAVYQESPPKVNACKKPGEWQTLVIEFRAPRFNASGEKTANARFVKVTLNGQVVQENFDIAHGTNVSRNAKEKAKAPVYLQGDHGPVAFRNLKLTPLD